MKAVRALLERGLLVVLTIPEGAHALYEVNRVELSNRFRNVVHVIRDGVRRQARLADHVVLAVAVHCHVENSEPVHVRQAAALPEVVPRIWRSGRLCNTILRASVVPADIRQALIAMIISLLMRPQ